MFSSLVQSPTPNALGRKKGRVFQVPFDLAATDVYHRSDYSTHIENSTEVSHDEVMEVGTHELSSSLYFLFHLSTLLREVSVNV